MHSPRGPFDGAVHAERSPPTLAQHTVQFAQRSWLIREEVETLLTENNVEIAGGKRHVERTTLRPVDGAPSLGRLGQQPTSRRSGRDP